MAKAVSNYVCQQCGYQSPSFLGKCPNCGAWNSFVETLRATPSGQARTSQKGRKITISDVKVVKLSEVEGKGVQRVTTRMTELDRVLGGGIVPGQAVLLAGDPGIGKSTLLLELARNFAGLDSQNLSNLVLYVAGEESASQIKVRAQRLSVVSSKIAILEQMDTDVVVEVLESLVASAPRDKQLGLVIVDSIQTMVTSDLEGPAGSVGQVRECASRLVTAVKRAGIPLFIVGHVTKEGTIAGPKVLEHVVDTVLSLEGERFSGLRLVRTSKNRFGPTDEVGIFQMTDGGLQPVIDTQGLFTDLEDLGKPGACLTIAMEGTRPMLVEIQALTASTPLPSARRVATGIDYSRLLTIVAILQKRLNVPLYSQDVYVSVSGGLKISEPAADLPVALALLSAFRNKSLPGKTVAVGELDLLGNVRSVNGLQRRVKEAKRLGFKNILTSETLRAISDFKF